MEVGVPPLRMGRWICKCKTNPSTLTSWRNSCLMSCSCSNDICIRQVKEYLDTILTIKVKCIMASVTSCVVSCLYFVYIWKEVALRSCTAKVQLSVKSKVTSFCYGQPRFLLIFRLSTWNAWRLYISMWKSGLDRNITVFSERYWVLCVPFYVPC